MYRFYKYGEFVNITYNANKSYCMVIESKPQDMKNIHCVLLIIHYLVVQNVNILVI